MRLRRAKPLPGEHTVRFLDNGAILILGLLTDQDVERIDRCMAARDKQTDERMREIARDEIKAGIKAGLKHVRPRLMAGVKRP